MKISSINNIDKYAAILIYGNDYGQVTQTVEQVIKKLASQPKTIFNFAQFSYDEVLKNPESLYNECHLLTITQEKRTILITDADKAPPTWLKELLSAKNMNVNIIFKAAELPASSALRKFFEQASNLAILPCYHDDKSALRQLINTTLVKKKLSIEPKAIDYLVNNIGADRLIAVSELNKIVLLKEEGQRITLDDVVGLTIHNSDVTVDEFCYNLILGNFADFEKNLLQLIESKMNIITIIRALLRIYQQCLKVVTLHGQGMGYEESVKKLTPPIFFKQVDIFIQCCRKLDMEKILNRIAQLNELELRCKTTNIDHCLLFENFVINSQDS